MTSETVKVTTSTSIQATLRKEFAKADQSIPYRLVGTYEYLKAIENFDQLVELSSSIEIKTYDRIIAAQREMAFFSGIATDYGIEKISRLPADEQLLINSFYRRNTLAWLLALAKVEVGATISMYGKSDDPFNAIGIGKTNFGKNEYAEIISDDLASHLKAVAGDPGFQNAMNVQKPNSDTLAYLRRAKLIQDLLNGLYQNGNSEQIAAARPYADKIDMFVDGLQRRIKAAERTMSASGQGGTGSATFTRQSSVPLQLRDLLGR